MCKCKWFFASWYYMYLLLLRVVLVFFASSQALAFFFFFLSLLYFAVSFFLLTEPAANGFGTGGSYVRRGKDRARPVYSGEDIFSRTYTWVLVVLGYSVLKYDKYGKKSRICVLPRAMLGGTVCIQNQTFRPCLLGKRLTFASLPPAGGLLR